MVFRKLSPADSQFLKGVAILLIMLHNYFHVLTNAPGENEFSFAVVHTYNFLFNLAAVPQDMLKQLFSFLGHYGVQLFVFLSGYGLATKYTATTQLTYRDFVFQRIRTIYPVLFFAVMLLFLYKVAVTLAFPLKEIDLVTYLEEAVLRLTLISNFIPGKAHIISGPWWFFSLIMQLYLLAPLLLGIKHKQYLLLLMAACWLVQLALLLYSAAAVAYLRVNFAGHLAEFCLGIYLARAANMRINKLLLAAVLLVFIAGAFNAYLWIIAFSCVPVLALAVYYQAAALTSSWFGAAMAFLGKNSLYLFAVHGLCRAPFVELGNQSIAWSVLASVGFLAVVTVLALLFKFIVTFAMEYFYKRWGSTPV